MNRRPKARSLALIYDEGAKAESASDNPYQPRQKHGDDIRSWLWTHGFEDAAAENEEIAALV